MDKNLINHITLTTGHLSRTSCFDVHESVQDLLYPWINQALASCKPILMPWSGFESYEAEMQSLSGALFVSVFRGGRPLIKMGVAQNLEQAEIVLATLSLDSKYSYDEYKRLNSPMCAVILNLSALACDLEASTWLGDFERSIAWTWIKRNSKRIQDKKVYSEIASMNEVQKQLITIANNGQAIVESNYWESEYAKNGLFFLSWNAGTARLLVPNNQKKTIREMHTAKTVIISRGSWPDAGGRDSLELLFEDYSDAPFVIHLVSEQCDRLISDGGKKDGFYVTVWTHGGEKLRLPGKFRTVKEIPCLQEWDG